MDPLALFLIGVDFQVLAVLHEAHAAIQILCV